MKTTLLIRTGPSLGYRLQDETEVKVVYKIETVPNTTMVHLLGDTQQVVSFESFEVSGLDLLAADFKAKGLNNSEATDLTLNHLKRIVAEYILKGDTLKKGAGLLGAHQIVYQKDTNNEAYIEMRRCEYFLKNKAKEL